MKSNAYEVIRFTQKYLGVARYKTLLAVFVIARAEEKERIIVYSIIEKCLLFFELTRATFNSTVTHRRALRYRRIACQFIGRDKNI